MELPIEKYRNKITEIIVDNSVVIVVGETGCGKTTQVPRYLYEAGLATDGRIGVTEPRRIAAISAAEFVAGQIGCKLGEEVGFQIRFNESTTEGTKVKFMTDGILLQEAKSDPLFLRYKVLIFDEAHERGIYTDFALGLVKRALAQRSDLKVVVMSATLEAGKFAKFFGEAPIISVEGRMYPVDERFMTEQEMRDALTLLNPKRGQEIEALAAFMAQKIHQSGLPGDILIFMPGEAEIHRVMRHIEFLNLSGLNVLAAYGNMNPDQQRRIFNHVIGRKVVVATNIAETSITIDGVVHVIDSGLIKESCFNSKTGIGALKVVEHSKAGLEQRKGRAGRTQLGICWRLFTKEEYEEGRWQYRRDWDEVGRPDYTKPEIQRSDLAGVVLRLAGIGIKNVESFDYIDAPSFEMLHGAVKTLEAIGAITEDRNVTEVGEKILDLPLDPRIGRMILEAQKFGCVREISAIAAKLSVRDFFVRPKDKEHEADAAKRQFIDKRSDLLTALAVLDAYEGYGWDRRWASENFLNWKAIEEALSIRRQIEDILERFGIELTSVGYHLPKDQYSLTEEEKRQEEEIGKAVLAGFIENLARSGYRHTYDRMSQTGGTLYIHPSSVLFGGYGAELLVAISIVETSRVFARDCQEVQVDWVLEAAPQAVKIKRTEARKGYFSESYTVYERVLLNGALLKEKEVPATEEEIRKADKDRLERNNLFMLPVFREIDIARQERIDAADKEDAELLKKREEKAQKKAASKQQEADEIAEQGRRKAIWQEYQQKLTEVEQKYKKYPGWGIYNFPIGSDGLPHDYQGEDGRTYSFDQDFFEVLPEKRVACWGYVTQWGHPTKVALVLEVE